MKYKYLVAIIIAFTLLCNLGMAQSQKPLDRETIKTETKALPKGETLVSERLAKDSPELKRAFADKKFSVAAEILYADGGMFLVETARISRDRERYAITFDVVNEQTKSAGEYKRLVYSFDGKEGLISFDEKNDRYVPAKSPNNSQKKLKWPPVWWPGSGGGSTGAGGGFSWGPWKPVKVECHPNWICPGLHNGIMRQEERASNSNPNIRQTRWILLHCYCPN